MSEQIRRIQLQRRWQFRGLRERFIVLEIKQ